MLWLEVVVENNMTPEQLAEIDEEVEKEVIGWFHDSGLFLPHERTGAYARFRKLLDLKPEQFEWISVDYDYGYHRSDRIEIKITVRDPRGTTRNFL